MKNIKLSAVLTVLLLSAFVSMAWAWEGNGTEQSPYKITNASELSNLATQVNSGNAFENTYFEVTDDISYAEVTPDDEGNNYTAIGTDKNQFKGLFNGNGYTISGIRINKPNALCQGLFGVLGKDAVVENVKLADVEITANAYIGGIACYNEGLVSNCIVESDVKIRSSGENSEYFGGIVGVNEGSVSGCTSSATLTSFNENSSTFGGIVGYNVGVVRNNLSKNVRVPAASNSGAVVGFVSDISKLSKNFYTACTVGDQENTTNIGIGGEESHSDTTANNDGVVAAYAITLGEGVSIESPENTACIINGENAYCKPGENLTLTADENVLIDEIRDVTTASIAAERNKASFEMPSNDVTIKTISTSDIYAVSVPDGLTISKVYAIIKNVKYCKPGQKDILIADENVIIEKIEGVEATIAADRRSATFTMPEENVSIGATIFKIWGDGDGSKDNPYTISRALELDTLALRLNGGNDYRGVYFKLAGDIEYSQEKWDAASTSTVDNYTAIGTEESPFEGIFDGDGHTISGIRIYKQDDDYQGLFGALGEEAMVKNVTLTNVEITAHAYIGGIAGYNKGSVSNIFVKNATISATQYYGAVFGRVGDASSLSNNFYTTCTIAEVENATNVGVGGDVFPSDVTNGNGAVSVSVTAPTAVEELVYDGSSHNLVTGGETNYGTMYYSLDGKAYSAEIPAASGANAYTVYYKVMKEEKWTVFDAQTLEVSIAQAPLTVTAKDKSIIYGDEPANDGVEYSGFIGDETASVLGGKLAYSYDYKKLDNVGEYTITPGGLTADNYDIKFVAGTLNVGKASLTVTVNADTITYGDQTPTEFGYTIEGLIDGDQLNDVTTSCGDDAISGYLAVGKYDISVSVKASSNPNYNVTAVGSKLTVQKKLIKVTGVTAKKRDYNGEKNVDLDGSKMTMEGYVENSDVSVDLSDATGTMEDANVGKDKAVTVTGIKLSGADAGNYVFKYPQSLIVTITQATPTVTAPAPIANLVYTGSAQPLVTAGKTDFGTLLYSLDGKDYSDKIPTTTEASTYTVYYKVAEGDNWNGIDAKKVEVSIAQVPLTVTAKDKSIVYGDDPANDGVEYSGFIGDETASVLGGKLTYSYDYKKLDKAGKYTITPSGLTASNYEITFVPGTLNVGKADVSVTAPVAKENLVYSGKSQELVSAGSTDYGTLLYSLDGKKFSEKIPTATDAKTYTVYYKVAENDNWNASDVQKVEVKIAKKETSAIGRVYARTDEFKMLRNYDLKGRNVQGKEKAPGAYYGKKVLNK